MAWGFWSGPHMSFNAPWGLWGGAGISGGRLRVSLVFDLASPGRHRDRWPARGYPAGDLASLARPPRYPALGLAIVGAHARHPGGHAATFAAESASRRPQSDGYGSPEKRGRL